MMALLGFREVEPLSLAGSNAVIRCISGHVSGAVGPDLPHLSNASCVHRTVTSSTRRV